ncbi:XRE family transcriptional regulator [Brevibacillus laterosporus]|uniref:XRE family transcriptional regulator n=1 Tax=Brevibacillus laterosporus TaxID=1465 RepID=A0A518V4B4_BRELA|nr:helix-turn-helix transcriptional regulator [Brevibacillus laterosporus]QDX91830.1 XRE family transcriptional regulator [Brevibacillus laterosporus]TPG70200.1 XRE family transcriptional regulator [Brevibacillus laterosporus]
MMEGNQAVLYSSLGELIKNKRQQANLSLSELGRLSGVSKGVLSKIESCETKRPELRTIKAITTVLVLPYEEIIENYIEIQQRVEILYELLLEMIELSNTTLIGKVAQKILENPQEDTYTALERLYDLCNSITGNEIRLTLYSAIIKYARVHGIPNYIAKPSLQKYLIERQDFKNLEESFKIGEEIIHYVDFLSEDEKNTFYFRMGLHAFAIKKYQQCIELTKTGLVEDNTINELKVRAYLAMINALLLLEKYDEVEKYLSIYKTFDFQFVHESATLTRAIVKAKKKDYEVAIPLLLDCLQNTSEDSRIHAVNELFELYLQMEKFEAIADLISQEDNFLRVESKTPYKYYSMGLYYQNKGTYQILVEAFEEGLNSYLTSMSIYGKINAYHEINECMKSILSYYFCEKKSVDLQMVQKLQDVYNRIIQNKIN